MQASAHLAEETLGANLAAPLGMIAGVVLCALSGFWVLIALIYYVPANLMTTSTDNPQGIGSFTALLQILSNADSNAMTVNALSALFAVAFFLSGAALTTVSTRIIFAMARDSAFPFSPVLHYLNPKTEMPLRSIALALVLTCLIELLPLGAFGIQPLQAVVNPFAFCLHLAYGIPLLLRVTVARRTFNKGPFHLGCFSEPCAWVATVWLLGTATIFLWPNKYASMNWGVVSMAVLGACACSSFEI